MPTIHPTAIVSTEARLADDVTVGPYAIIDGPVTVGAGCQIQAHARLIGPLTMGSGNVVHSCAVLGDWPQDRKYKGEFSQTIIGNDNIFRESVTIHRGTGQHTRTVIGNHCFFMANSHVGHNSVVADYVTLVNGAVMGGHTWIGERAILGAYCQVHQFCRIGRLVMISNGAGQAVDFPPFFLSMTTNAVNQLNSVGLRRSGMPRSSINGLRQMFQFAFRQQNNRPLSVALAELAPEIRAVPEVQEVIAFCKEAKRGVARFIAWSRMKGIPRVDVSENE